MTNDSQQPIVIAGGGMVGASLALLLARWLPAVEVVLVEKMPFPQTGSQQTLYSTSFDARSTALSESSREFYTLLGLWEKLAEHLTPIQQIHVSDRGHIGSTRMRAEEQELDALGYVMENHWLGQVLMAELQQVENIQVLAPATITAVRQTKIGPLLTIASEQGEAQQLAAQLLIVADGTQSPTSQLLGIGYQVQRYGQMALVANISLEGGQQDGHQNVAYERFTDQGPLALLPLEPLDGEARSGLIWTLPPEQCEQLMVASDKEFLQTLQQRFGQRLGTLTRVGKRQSYPLQLVTADELVRRGVAVVGNAASALHPVAGQGFNLALRGVALLADCLRQADSKSQPLGDLAVLQQYAQQHQADRESVIAMSDWLPKLFGNKAVPIALGRNIGLLAMDAAPPLRQLFANFGTGLAANLNKERKLGGQL